MKMLIFGADGFIGSHLVVILKAHVVYTATRNGQISDHSFNVDLSDRASVLAVMDKVHPDVIVNCAGIVANTDAANMNVVFSENILNAVHQSSGSNPKVIICGSAGTYGFVQPEDVPVSETTLQRAKHGYGLSKLNEEKRSLELGQKFGIPVIVARIFNPIGKGMHERFLIPQIIQQVRDCKNGFRKTLEVSRLDSKRDYIAVKDVAEALKKLAEDTPKDNIYNIGSGKATSNKDLIDAVIREIGLETIPDVVQTSDKPEQLVAIQADIRRISDEFEWHPKHPLTDVIKEIIDATR